MNIFSLKKRHFVLVNLACLPGSMYAGEGIIAVLQYTGITSVPKSGSFHLGMIAVYTLFILPHFIRYFIALKKVKRYSPITNEKIRDHRSFYIKHIDREILYLKKAMNYVPSYYKNSLENVTEIRSLLINNAELEEKQLDFLNLIFNEKNLIKELA